jgi:hypothetical protein
MRAVKYIRARLPSEARRARLVRVWAPLHVHPILEIRFYLKSCTMYMRGGAEAFARDEDV